MSGHRYGWLIVALLAVNACRRDAGAPAAPDSADERHNDGGAARVSLSEEAFAAARIAVEPAGTQAPGDVGVALELPGQVQPDPRRLVLISPRVAGRIERLAVAEGERVEAGQAVAFIHSPAFIAAQSDYAQAVRRFPALAGTADGPGARALADAAGRRLRLAGGSDADMERLRSSGDIASLLTLEAPMPGSILKAEAMPGAAVEPGSPLFTLADLSVVDVVAQVPERALPVVRLGQGATIRIAAYPTLSFRGHVERLHDDLAPETRTVDAVIHVPNTSRALRPGMFATVALDVPVRAAVPDAGAAVVTIPEGAVVTDGEARYVFVEVGARTYERRLVTVRSLAPAGSATSSGGRVAVTDGVRAGERVVVRGAFVLKSELAKAAFAEEEH